MSLVRDLDVQGISEEACEDMGEQERIVSSDERCLPRSRARRPQALITCREHAAYRMQQRVSPDDWLVRNLRLFQEWLVSIGNMCDKLCL